jgi:phosphate transport system permease protein
MALYDARRRRNAIVMGLCVAASAFGLAFLVLILGALLWKGLAGLTLVLFTEMTPPPGSSGGLLNAILGSLIMTVLGVAFGAPLGMLAGTYMAEYGRYSRPRS